MKAEELIRFEEDIAHEWESGHIHAPVHLQGGNEKQLINIFKDIFPDDWVFSTHRSHYHALLKGVPKDEVKKEILDGHSISLNFPRYHFYTSAIVGGNLPIATGVALAGHRVWCFCGDMASNTGIFWDCLRFSQLHRLPITFVIEDNGYSVQTPTQEVCLPIPDSLFGDKVIRYQYKNMWPHQGNGTVVSF
jgi:pyruvate dehydrogenase E1 component alpha subunit